MNVVVSANSLVDLELDQDRDTSVTKEGKISTLCDNLRDMISPYYHYQRTTTTKNASQR